MTQQPIRPMSICPVLTHDAWTLALRPDLGGAVLSLTYEDRAVLRPSPTDPRDVLETASFPLVPYANRIAHGRFEYDGHTWQVPLNFGEHPHALHGVGWQAPWQIVDHRPERIVLRHVHDGGRAWPWPYVAEQRIELTDDAATFELAIVSHAELPVPVGLGFHPAFPVANDTVLQTRVGSVWLADQECLPTVRAAANRLASWDCGARVRRSSLIDHCHEGWGHRLTLSTSGLSTVLSASPGLDWLHIYVPPGADYCCAEPVSHMPDAINRAVADDHTGLRLLPPERRMSVWMRIAVESILR